MTLADLAAVVVVAGLLVLVLPTAMRAADQMSRTRLCAANLAEVAKGIQQYAQAHQDSLPPYRSAFRRGRPFSMPMSQPAFTHHLSKVGDLDPVSLKQNWRGIGMVYGAGFVKAPTLFYCPAQTVERFLFESYENPVHKQAVKNAAQMAKDAAIGGYEAPEFHPEYLPPRFGSYSTQEMFVHSGYLWNCWGRRYPPDQVQVQDAASQPSEPLWDLAFRTLSSVQADKPLGMDMAIYPTAIAAHSNYDTDPPSFNVLRVDGRVECFQPALDYQQALKDNWHGEDKPGPHSRWADNPGPLNDWEEAYTFITKGPPAETPVGAGT